MIFIHKKFLLVLLILLVGGVIMPRGGPDGNLSPFSFAAQAIDPGLIYQMLWGFSPVDSMGRVMYFDTFNNGLGGFGKDVNGTGTPADPALFSTPLSRNIFSPPNALILSPGVTSGDNTAIFRELYFGFNAKLGIETVATISQTNPNYYFRIIYRLGAGKDYRAVLKYDHTGSKWLIETSGGDVTVYQMNVTGLANVHQQVKIVADWNTGKYVRALIGDNLIDISSFTMQHSGVIDGLATYTFRAVSYGAGTTDGFLGYVLLTKDEP